MAQAAQESPGRGITLVRALGTNNMFYRQHSNSLVIDPILTVTDRCGSLIPVAVRQQRLPREPILRMARFVYGHGVYQPTIRLSAEYSCPEQ
jgi:hypothetical protein